MFSHQVFLPAGAGILELQGGGAGAALLTAIWAAPLEVALLRAPTIELEPHSVARSIYVGVGIVDSFHKWGSVGRTCFASVLRAPQLLSDGTLGSELRR